MRLSKEQKFHVFTARPAADLVRVGDRWTTVWKDDTLPPAERWRGELITRVDEDGGVWFRPEVFGRTRKAVIEQLQVEV